MEVEQYNSNERKKEYLKSYLKCKREVKRLESELDEIRLARVCPSVSIDDMPHSHVITDMSDYVAKCDEMLTMIMQKKEENIARFLEIEYSIAAIKDRDERFVLSYRYIFGWNWNAIAEEMHYVVRQILRFHGNALQHFEIYEEVMSHNVTSKCDKV